MTDWTETYRGTVPPWQCDVTEHFTIAYYFDRLEEAEASLADEPGLSDLSRRPGLVRRMNVRFARELRKGASFHVESGALGVDDGGVRVGHRFVDSANGEVVTWFDERWDLSLTTGQRDTIAGRVVEWNGPAAEQRTEPAGPAGFIPSARGRVKTSDVDIAGNFALGAMVHQFSNASGQFGAAIGMDGEFMHKNRRGFSTFELTVRIAGSLPLDAPYLVRTGVAHLGNSSLRMSHRMTDARSGDVIAVVGQFGVNLDLDARRPARWPEEIRARAAALMVASE